MEKQEFKRVFSEDRVKDDYSKVAWFYDIWGRLTESKAAHQVIEKASIQSGDHILEVAVGTGNVFREIVKRNPEGMNEGLDLSGSMLAQAEKKLQKLKKESFHLQTGNAYQLPFDDGTFDLVVNNFMLDLLPENDFEKVLKEFYRVLKPSGRVVISTMAFGHKRINRIWHWIARKFPGLLTGCRPVSMGSYLISAGFTDLVVDTISQNTFPSEVLLARKGPSAD